MESDEECDAYAAVIVAAAVIEPEKQPNATARGGYIRTPLREEATYQLMPLIKQV